MNYNYKIVIFGGGIYQEAPLEITEDGVFRVGTHKNCNVRFDKNHFFEDIELDFVVTESGWKLDCSNNIYIDRGGVMKLHSTELTHGDTIELKYSQTKAKLFSVSFMIDFDIQDYHFDRVIDIAGRQSVVIGGDPSCDIYILSPLAAGDTMTLMNQGGIFGVQDNGSRNGVYINGTRMYETAVRLNDKDFFMIDGCYFYLSGTRVYTSSRDVQIRSLQFMDLSESKSRFTYPKFERNVRIRRVIPDEPIEVLGPKEAPQKDRKSFWMNILPSIISLILMIVIRGMMSRNSTFIIYSASVMGMGVIISIISFIRDKKQYRKDVADRIAEYTAYAKEREVEIQKTRQHELEILREKFVTLDEEVAKVADFNPMIFEKNPDDDDFLEVRLGTGTIVAHSQVEYKHQEFKDPSDPLLDYPEQLAKAYRFIDDAPVTLDLKQCNAVGFVGQENTLYDMLKTVTTHITVSHFYEDVRFYFLFREEDLMKFYNLRWLKNATDERSGVRNFMYDEESRKNILEILYKELVRREGALEENEHGETNFNDVLVFSLDTEELKSHPISNFFSKAASLHFRFIFFEAAKELLPMACDRVIYLNAERGNNGVIVDAHNGDNQQKFIYKTITDMNLKGIVDKLANTYVEQASLESTLHNITLYEMLGILQADDIDLSERWQNSRVYETMAAPLGIRGNGSVVYLDLSDKAHGPHGLVAGTTGSGKSEIIQTYILSMATLFHPYDVGFMIIDFKGGGMANQFQDLPHLMGTITNIDGHEIDRSLRSIKAELLKRQEIFSEAGVNNISDYIRKFKRHEVEIPMPHLIMICDEFAELKAEYPDFMKEIVSAARIGRTLGVHLILATQKPAGVVDNQIWSNSKFKLCLKVQTREDSNEMLKSPLASEIREPGRAYFQVGNNEIFELFQSAYSGAKAAANVGDEKTFELFEVNLWGGRKKVFSNKKKGDDVNEQTQLEAIIEHVKNYCDMGHIAKLKGICLPPLPEMLYMKDLPMQKGGIDRGIMANIGIYDDPEAQLQAPLTVNFSENIYIAGASQMGKTTLMQTMIYNLMDVYSPDEVNIYIIDCGNMALKVFEEARQVGGVVLASEEEKLTNLFKMLLSIVDQRKETFSMKGLGTFKAYIEAGFKDMPQIILFLDNIAVFKEQYPEYFDTILSLSREGSGVGINFVVSGTQANSFGFKALANYSTRLALVCTEKGEYSNFFSRCRIEPAELPGRGLCEIDKQIKEFHTALAFTGEKEIERVENMRKFIRENAAKYGSRRARPIPVVPKLILEEITRKNQPELYQDPSKMPYGVNFDDISYRYLDFSAQTMVTVSGGEGKGKNNFAKLIMNHLCKNIFNYNSHVYLFDSDEERLGMYKEKRIVKKYTSDTSEFLPLIDEFMNEVVKRQEKITMEGKNNVDWAKLPQLVLILNTPVAMAELNKKKDYGTKLAGVVKNCKKMKISIFLTHVDNATIALSSNDLLKVVKETKSAVVFEEIESIKLIDLSVKQIKAYSKALSQGDAFEFAGNSIFRIKTFLAEDILS